jgi:hypothetical protein
VHVIGRIEADLLNEKWTANLLQLFHFQVCFF